MNYGIFKFVQINMKHLLYMLVWPYVGRSILLLIRANSSFIFWQKVSIFTAMIAYRYVDVVVYSKC